jgi:hypothetical protein
MLYVAIRFTNVPKMFWAIASYTLMVLALLFLKFLP